MKKIALLLILCLTVCFAFTGCGSDKDKTSTVSETPDNTVTEETVEEGPVILENFSGGSVESRENSINLKFDISSIEMQEKGLTFYYTISRDSSGYKNYYSLGNVKLNGCHISNIDYYAGDILQEDMGKNLTEDKSLPLNFVVNTETLNTYGITNFNSFEFQLSSGYTAYSSATNQYSEQFILYSGKASANEKHQLVSEADHITLVDNDKCKIVITNTVWLTDYKDDILGQKYSMYCQTYDKYDVFVTFDKLKIGDLEEQPEELALSNGYGSYSFQLDKSTTYMLTSNWRDKANPLDASMFENAVWNMTLKYINDDGETTETVSVPVNLSVPLEQAE